MALPERQFTINFKGKKVLSLDVFDTSLLRRVAHPLDVFDLMEQELSNDKALHWLSGGPFGFSELRAKAESNARQKLTDSQKTPEETLDEIYVEFARLTEISDEHVEYLKRLEMDVEMRVMAPNPEILALAREARRQGVQVVFVSDMYLPTECVTRMLAAAGYDVTVEHVFMSCHFRKAKWNGELYGAVSRALGIPLGKFVHVGDNMTSDVIMARKCGITAYHYEKLGERLAKAESRGRGFVSPIVQPDRSLALGVRNGILARDLVAAAPATSNTNFWFRLGYEKAGILFLGFTLWLIEESRRDKLDTLLFLARDGLIMKRCFDLVCEWKGIAANSLYVYGSRRATWFPGLLSMDDDDITFLIGGKYQTLRTYFERCGLKPGEYERVAMECGFASADEKIESYDDWRRLKTAFKKLADSILLAAAAESKVVISYLDQIGIPAKGRIGVIDVGWWGSMQEGFERLLRLSGRECSVTGYYVGTHEKAKKAVSQGRTMKGYALNLGEPDETRTWIDACVGLLEFLFVAPHGTCLGFEEVDGEVRPILDDNKLEEENAAKASQLQEGVIQFLHSAQYFIERFEHLDLDARGALYPWAQVMKDPTRQEAEMLGDLTHVDGIGKSERTYFANPRYQQRGSSAERDTVFWPIGYAKRTQRGWLARG